MVRVRVRATKSRFPSGRCQPGKVRRQNLSAEYDQADKGDIPLPAPSLWRKLLWSYKRGYVSSIRLGTRAIEVSLWLYRNDRLGIS